MILQNIFVTLTITCEREALISHLSGWAATSLSQRFSEKQRTSLKRKIHNLTRQSTSNCKASWPLIRLICFDGG